VPKLWTETIEGHRRAVRDAILDNTFGLVAERGLGSVTMTQIAEASGIGRATLYKYFPDVESILRAWHDRRIADHLGKLVEARDRAGGAGERLAAVLTSYALATHEIHEHRGTDLSAFLHDEERLAGPHKQLRDLLRDLLAEAAAAGELRDDVAPEELVSFCLHALAAASSLPSKAAVRRLVEVTLAGLRPPGRSSTSAPSRA
jgi:AcrR family transcriptional regulator